MSPLAEIRPLPVPKPEPKPGAARAGSSAGADEAADSSRATAIAAAPALASLLDDLCVEVEEGQVEPGSCPLPQHLEILRAIYGGISRHDLEDYWLSRDANGVHTNLAAGERYRQAIAAGRLSAGPHVFIGQTGGAKTGLAVGLALGAVHEGHPVVYCSLELDKAEVGARVIAQEIARQQALAAAAASAGRQTARDLVPGEDGWLGRFAGAPTRHVVPWPTLWRRKQLSPGQRDARTAAVQVLREPSSLLRIWAPDPGPDEEAPSVAQLARIVFALWRETGRTPLVIFDYLQYPGLIAADAEEEARLQARERFGRIFRGLRHITRADALPDDSEWAGCPIVVLSTTARENVRGGLTAPSGMSGDDPDALRRDNLETLKALAKEASDIEAGAVAVWAMGLEAGGARRSPLRRLTMRLAKSRASDVGQWAPLVLEGATGLIADAPWRYREAYEADKAAAEERERRAQEKHKGAKGEAPAASGGPQTPPARPRSDGRLIEQGHFHETLETADAGGMAGNGTTARERMLRSTQGRTTP